MNEKRQFQRVRFAAETVVEIRGELIKATLMDISLKGALVAVHDGRPPDRGEPCRLMIHLDMSDVTLSFGGVVAHGRDDLFGITYTAIDIDTMIHLRNLMELNSGDPDLVRSELASFIES